MRKHIQKFFAEGSKVSTGSSMLFRGRHATSRIALQGTAAVTRQLQLLLEPLESDAQLLRLPQKSQYFDGFRVVEPIAVQKPRRAEQPVPLVITDRRGAETRTRCYFSNRKHGFALNLGSRSSIKGRSNYQAMQAAKVPRSSKLGRRASARRAIRLSKNTTTIRRRAPAQAC
jgi:hypothetical protein